MVKLCPDLACARMHTHTCACAHTHTHTHTHTETVWGGRLWEGGAAFFHLEPGTRMAPGRGILQDRTFLVIFGVKKRGSTGRER